MRIIDIICVITLIVVCFLVFQLQTNNSAISALGARVTQLQIELDNKGDESDIFVSRAYGVMAGSVLRGVRLDEAKAYAVQAQEWIIDDNKVLKDHLALLNLIPKYNLHVVRVNDNEIRLFDEWLVQWPLDGESRHTFLTMPQLAVNNELLRMPNCQNGQVPAIIAIPAYRNGAQFEGQLTLEDKVSRRWVITIPENDAPMKDKRVVFNTFCE